MALPLYCLVALVSAGPGLESKPLSGASVLSLPTLDHYYRRLSQRWAVEAEFIEPLACCVHWDNSQACPSCLRGPFCSCSLDCRGGHVCSVGSSLPFPKRASGTTPDHVWETGGDRKDSGLALFLGAGVGGRVLISHPAWGPGMAVGGGQAGSALGFLGCSGQAPGFPVDSSPTSESSMRRQHVSSNWMVPVKGPSANSD